MDGSKAAAGEVAPSRLEVRPLHPDEAPLVVMYFLDASDADIERMGVDRGKLPDAEAWRKSLVAAMLAPSGTVTSFYTAWLVDGKCVGYAALKNIRSGQSADIHLHMWSAPHRGKGHGATLFCLSALDAYQRFQLKTLVCEPKADNPMPNRMLAKVGFRLVRSYVGASSELSATTTLNRYAIDRDVAQRFLGALAGRP